MIESYVTKWSDIATATDLPAWFLRALAATPEEREADYRTIREWAMVEYDRHVGTRATRSVAKQAEKLREAADSHYGQGDRHRGDLRSQRSERLWEELSQVVARYDAVIDAKHLLAILTGRYDGRLPSAAHLVPGDRGDRDDLIVQAVSARRQEAPQAVEKAEEKARIEQEASEVARANLERIRLLYPPVGWGASEPDLTRRLARWQSRTVQHRLSDPNPRDVASYETP